VVAPDGEAGGIPEVDETVREGDTVRVGGLEGRVIVTPGHTSAPATLYFGADKLLFAGDTLFSIGCGRVIEGTMAQMWESMLKLRALPDDTMLYCGHEYTLANIRFAKTVEPDNPALAAREQEVTQLLAAGKMTAPSPLREEKAANPFLRADLPEVAKAVGMAGAPAAEVFAEIRTRKNKF
jgi:hydroxyacylglutathione hydrolase